MNNLLSAAIVCILGVLFFTLTDPFMYWMPNMVQMVALTIAAALLAVFAGFFLRESAEDEREIIHRMRAGRAAFLSGILVLTVALVYQGLTHSIDRWILIALGAMILAKLVARWHADKTA